MQVVQLILFPSCAFVKLRRHPFLVNFRTKLPGQLTRLASPLWFVLDPPSQSQIDSILLYFRKLMMIC